MRTDGDSGHRIPVSRRTFVAAVGVHAGPAMIGAGATPSGSDGSVRFAVTDPYRPGLERAVASYASAGSGRDIRLVPAGADASDRLGDDVDALVSGQPTLSSDDPPSSVVRSVAVVDWAALGLPDGRWRECLRRREVHDCWRGGAPVETWSESDWDSVATVARTGDPTSAKRDDRARSESIPLVLGTRAYQYAHGHGGLGHYRVEAGALDRDARVRSAERDGAAPLVQLGYVHVDRNVVDDDVRSFLEAYDHRTGDDTDVAYFSGSDRVGDAMVRSPHWSG